MPRTKVPLTSSYLLLIVAVASIAVSPMMLFGNPCGHDFDLHVPAWMETSQQLRQGILFPRWTAGANSGFGAPFFIFYPPLSRTIGAVLGLLLPWQLVPGIYVWMVLIVAGLAMWKCATEWLEARDALIASLLFATNPYLLLTAYKRCNYAELLATALFPLLVWGGIRVGRGDFQAVLPLSAVFAALWITDLPAAVIASYSLAGLLILGAIFYRSLRPLWYGAGAILIGFGTIAFFLLPAAWERRWVSIGQALKFEWAPEHNFLFSHSNTAQYGTFNRGLSFFVLAVVMVTAIAALFTRQMRRNDPQDWRLLVALGAVSTSMMLPPSMILYRILPQLRFVEFPWRWLSPLCVVYAVLTASAMARNGKRWLLWAAAGCMIAAMGGVIVHTTWWDSGHRHMQELVASIPAGIENKGAIWASPLGSTPANLDKAAALVSSAESTSGNSTAPLQINVERWSAEQKVFSIDAPRPLLLRLKLLSYPAWQGKVNGKSVHLETDQDTGQILLEVPGGLSHVEIRFGRTVDRTAGIVITALTALLFVPLTFWMGKRKFKTEG